MTLHTRRLLRVTIRLKAAQHERSEDATARVRKRAQDVRRWHPALEGMDWNEDSTLMYIKRLADASVKEEGQKRVATWKEKWNGVIKTP